MYDLIADVKQASHSSGTVEDDGPVLQFLIHIIITGHQSVDSLQGADMARNVCCMKLAVTILKNLYLSSISYSVFEKAS